MFSCTSPDQVDLSATPTCLCCQPQLQSAARRINRDLSRRGFIAGVGASLASLGLFRPAGARAAPPGPTPPIVFGNFLLFDGKSNALREGLRLLVEGNRIKSDRHRRPDPTGRRADDRLRRTGHDAGSDRRALAYDLRGAPGSRSVLGRHRLYLPCRERRGRADADAGLHDRPGPRRPVLCVEAGDRRRARRQGLASIRRAP